MLRGLVLVLIALSLSEILISAGADTEDEFNSWQRGVPIVHGGEERVQISSPKIIL